jgi:hypothetical protein
MWEETHMKESNFDGGLLGLIGWNIIAFLITFLSFGLLYPFAIVLVLRWRVEHTVINGQRLFFRRHGDPTLWELDQVVTPDDRNLWDLWLLGGDRHEEVGSQAYAFRKLKGDDVTLFLLFAMGS